MVALAAPPQIVRLRWRRLRDKLSGPRATDECSTKDFISVYYREEPGRLKEMLGFEVPWPSTRPPVVAGIEASS